MTVVLAVMFEQYKCLRPWILVRMFSLCLSSKENKGNAFIDDTKQQACHLSYHIIILQF